MNTRPIATNKIVVGLFVRYGKEVKRIVAPSRPIATNKLFEFEFRVEDFKVQSIFTHGLMDF